MQRFSQFLIEKEGFLKVEGRGFNMKKTENLSLSNPQNILKDRFGFNGFKPQQSEIITRILKENGDTLGIMPTGGGKSLCFQIPSLIQNNLTLVVSPLIALMKDQVDQLTKKGIPAFFINSTLPEETKEEILNLVKMKKAKLLYLAPESLKSERILDVLKETKIDLFVIDEAHCISTWGHNFRPDYLRFPEILDKLNKPRILALTATATKEVEKDIKKQLKRACKIFKASFDRPNLYLEINPLEDNVEKEQYLADLVSKLEGPTLIYATYQKTTEELSKILKDRGIKSLHYHAGLKPEEREETQNSFFSGDCDVIVATIAFGMGIDKPNIRNLIHYNIPQSVEGYYQEVGRAGRDGEHSSCITLYSKKDERKIKELISFGWPDKHKIIEVLSFLKGKNSDYFITTAKRISYNCGVEEIPVNLILQKLEELNAIKIYNNVPECTKLDFNKDYKDIIKELPEYATDLKKIFSCSFFNNKKRKWFFYEEIMQETELNYFRIKEILDAIKNNRYAKFSETKRCNLFWIKDSLGKVDIEPLAEKFKQILDKDIKKVDLLISSINTHGCIRKKILEYFDEPNLKDNCEMCSNCIKDKHAWEIKKQIDADYASEEEIGELRNLEPNINEDTTNLIILKSITRHRDMIPKKDLAKILLGNLNKNCSNWKFSLDCFGLLRDSKEEAYNIDKTINSILKDNFIKEDVDGTLRITKKGVKYLSENSKS